MDSLFQIAIYPFLFLALFFEIFLALTFFESEGKKLRRKEPKNSYPAVSIIVPCYNEEKTVARTIESLLSLAYPQEKLTLILVDDGSTDSTSAVLASYEKYPNIRVIKKENGGKHTALNAGIEVTETEFVGGMDADSFVSPEALKEIMAHFDEEKIGAVTGALSVWKPKGLLGRMQQAEYLLGIALRHALSVVNGLYVAPGPLSVYRRQVFTELGKFKPAHHTEDMEMAMRMQKHHWKIANAPRARVYTTAPKSVRALVRQRTRWVTGFIRNGFDYRELYGNPLYGALGLLVLPLGTVSLVGMITLFILLWLRLGEWLYEFIERTSSVPLSFTFQLPSFNFDWFFIPLNSIMVIAAVAMTFMFIRMGMGATISKTKSSLGLSVLWYVPLYSLIAPLWVIRAVADVTLGIRRSWR